MSEVTLNSCLQVLSRDETTDLMLWPVLRLATEDFLRRVHHVFFFNKALSALLMTDQGRVYALGNNDHDCLGVGSQKSLVTEPTEVLKLQGKTLVQCASGDGFVMVLTNNGDLYGWGLNQCGQVGSGNQNQVIPKPVLVWRGITMVSCGARHSAALRRNGSVLSWGDNTHHQLGFSTKNNYLSKPGVVEALKGKHVVQVDCGKFITVALTKLGELYHWGDFDRIFAKVESPRLSDLPWGLKPVAFAASDRSCLILCAKGSPHRLYYDDCHQDGDHVESVHRYSDKEYWFYCEHLDIIEPMQAVINAGSSFCLKLQSGQVVLCSNRYNKILTSLTSMADASALFGGSLAMRGMTAFSSNLITPALMQSISKFNNPLHYDLKLTDGNKDMLLDTTLAAQCSTYLEKRIQTIWQGKSSVMISDFYVYFNFVRYVCTGTVSAIEYRWINQLLSIATESKAIGLRELCYHYLTNHVPNGYQLLLQSRFGPIEDIFTVASFAQLTKESEKNEPMDNKIWRLVAIQSLSTARKILSNLQAISGKSVQSTTVSLPESYLQWMVCHSDHNDLLTLLQDPSQGPVYSRHLTANITTDNFFIFFQVAVETKNQVLQERVVRYVANLDSDNLISFLTSDQIEQVTSGEFKAFFTEVSKWRATSRSTKRSVDTSSPQPINPRRSTRQIKHQKME